MHSNLRVFFVLAIALLVIGFAPKASACSCVPPGPIAESLANSSAVFEGVVLSEIEGAEQSQVVLGIVQAWKGITTTQVTVVTAGNSAMCGYNFEVGHSYLVFATFIEGGENLEVGLCSRTHQVVEGDVDKRALGPGLGPTDLVAESARPAEPAAAEPDPIARPTAEPAAPIVAPSSRGCGCSLPTRSSDASGSLGLLVGIALVRAKRRILKNKNHDRADRI